jgi:uncharacterized protein (TIGR02453 family)
MAEFAGFPREATGFFQKLARNNNREWFLAHKETYERACRDPLTALVTELDPMGPCRITRINRDMRFARDGRPYKTHISAGVRSSYISLSSEGLWVGTGLYRPEPPMLRTLRAAIADSKSGPLLATIVRTLQRKGYDIDTHESLNAAPRGYAADHPRIELLKMKDIYAGRLVKPGSILSSRKALAAVKGTISDVAPLADWLRRYVC